MIIFNAYVLLKLMIKNKVLHTISGLIKNQFDKTEYANKQYILTVLLISSILLALLAFIVRLIQYIFNFSYDGVSPLVIFIFFIFFIFLFFLSKKNYSKISSILLVLFLFCAATYTSYQWGVDSGEGLLIYALVIVLSGILIGTRFALFETLLIVLCISLVNYLHQHLLIPIDLSWTRTLPSTGTTLVFNATLVFIAVVSWLSNREIEKSLQRVKESEAALQRERDKLEEMVERRTAQLQQTQVEKMSQLYRFIEFGKLAAGLFHDFMTPLNLVSLNLENIKEESKEPYKDKVVNIQKYLRHALYGTKRLEKFISVARKQLHDDHTSQTFSLTKETEQIINLFTYKAKLSKIAIHFKYSQSIRYHGNQHKFSQIITNLLSNALDSYTNANEIKNKRITIALYKKNKQITFVISDNGEGMQKKEIEKIFDPLYTTKQNSQHMGLGLYLIKGIIQDDFGGTISVKSKLNKGSNFSVSFPETKEPYAR